MTEAEATIREAAAALARALEALADFDRHLAVASDGLRRLLPDSPPVLKVADDAREMLVAAIEVLSEDLKLADRMTKGPKHGQG